MTLALNLAYAVLPFLLSLWIKIVAKWVLRDIVSQAIEKIPGGDLRGFNDQGVVKVVTTYIVHAEQKLLLILSYFSSACAAFIIGLRAEIPQVALVGGTVLVVIGAGLHALLQACPAEAFDEPLRGWLRLSPSSLAFTGAILLDCVLMSLAGAAVLLA